MPINITYQLEDYSSWFRTKIIHNFKSPSFHLASKTIVFCSVVDWNIYTSLSRSNNRL